MINKNDLQTVRFFSREMAGDKYGTYKDYIKGIDQQIPWKLIKRISNLKHIEQFIWRNGKQTMEVINIIEIYKPVNEAGHINIPELWFAHCANGRFMALDGMQKKKYIQYNLKVGVN